jgi:hypothetical protein
LVVEAAEPVQPQNAPRHTVARRTGASEHLWVILSSMNRIAMIWPPSVFLVVEDVVHYGRSPADLRRDHVSVDGFGDVGGLVA